MTPANLKLTLRNISVPDKSSLNKFLVYIYIYIYIYIHMWLGLFLYLILCLFPSFPRWCVGGKFLPRTRYVSTYSDMGESLKKNAKPETRAGHYRAIRCHAPTFPTPSAIVSSFWNQKNLNQKNLNQKNLNRKNWNWKTKNRVANISKQTVTIRNGWRENSHAWLHRINAVRYR